LNTFQKAIIRHYELYFITYLYSAGVGRTGTFIALDALYEHGLETGYVDIMEYVQMMRKDRMNMIQTKVSFVIKCKS
jgi:protein tyrosine phosphatase